MLHRSLPYFRLYFCITKCECCTIVNYGDGVICGIDLHIVHELCCVSFVIRGIYNYMHMTIPV